MHLLSHFFDNATKIVQGESLPHRGDPSLQKWPWSNSNFMAIFNLCAHDPLQIKQIPKEAGHCTNVPTVRFYSLGLTFGYKLIVFFPSPCIRHQNLASFWNDFAHNTTLNTLYFCIIHEYWNNCGHNVGSHLEWLCIHHCPWTTQLSP